MLSNTTYKSTVPTIYSGMKAHICYGESYGRCIKVKSIYEAVVIGSFNNRLTITIKKYHRRGKDKKIVTGIKDKGLLAIDTIVYIIGPTLTVKTFNYAIIVDGLGRTMYVDRYDGAVNIGILSFYSGVTVFVGDKSSILLKLIPEGDEIIPVRPILEHAYRYAIRRYGSISYDSLLSYLILGKSTPP